jgi:hypothetical protein
LNLICQAAAQSVHEWHEHAKLLVRRTQHGGMPPAAHRSEKELRFAVAAGCGGGEAAFAATSFAWLASSRMTSSTVGLQQQRPERYVSFSTAPPLSSRLPETCGASATGLQVGAEAACRKEACGRAGHLARRSLSQQRCMSSR